MICRQQAEGIAQKKRGTNPIKENAHLDEGLGIILSKE